MGSTEKPRCTAAWLREALPAQISIKSGPSPGRSPYGAEGTTGMRGAVSVATPAGQLRRSLLVLRNGKNFGPCCTSSQEGLKPRLVSSCLSALESPDKCPTEKATSITLEPSQSKVKRRQCFASNDQGDLSQSSLNPMNSWPIQGALVPTFGMFHEDMAASK